MVSLLLVQLGREVGEIEVLELLRVLRAAGLMREVFMPPSNSESVQLGHPAAAR